MKSISLYVDKDTYLTRMHPFTKLCYILTAVVASLIAGKLWAFAIFIGISLVMLISGKIMKKRILASLLALSMLLSVTACSSGPQTSSTDCFFIYNSDHHIFDPWFI